ncbi:hypothetical protein, partial [Sulfuricurvum sp.]|uniref:hypothetical protein n=1 Tax=Sulfuricurvum sp. TaxID=2025608 RepID=UPI0026366FFB
EVGSFFEVYEVNNAELKIGKAKEVAEFLNIQLTRKNKTILENIYYTISTMLNNQKLPIANTSI